MCFSSVDLGTLVLRPQFSLIAMGDPPRHPSILPPYVTGAATGPLGPYPDLGSHQCCLILLVVLVPSFFSALLSLPPFFFPLSYHLSFFAVPAVMDFESISVAFIACQWYAICPSLFGRKSFRSQTLLFFLSFPPRPMTLSSLPSSYVCSLIVPSLPILGLFLSIPITSVERRVPLLKHLFILHFPSGAAYRHSKATHNSISLIPIIICIPSSLACPSSVLRPFSLIPLSIV